MFKLTKQWQIRFFLLDCNHPPENFYAKAV